MAERKRLTPKEFADLKIQEKVATKGVFLVVAKLKAERDQLRDQLKEFRKNSGI